MLPTYQLMDQDEQIEQASRAMKAMSHPLRFERSSAFSVTKKSRARHRRQVGTSQTIFPSIWPSCVTKVCCVPTKDANRVFYRVQRYHLPWNLISMMRDVFCKLRHLNSLVQQVCRFNLDIYILGRRHLSP